MTIQLMAHSQRIEQRVGTERHSLGGHSSRGHDGGRKDADAGYDYKIGSLLDGEGKAPDASKVFDIHEFRCENIRHTYRVDEIGHVSPHPGLMPDRVACIRFRELATVHNLKIESKQAVSGCCPPVSTNVVDGLRGHESQIGAA